MCPEPVVPDPVQPGEVDVAAAIGSHDLLPTETGRRSVRGGRDRQSGGQQTIGRTRGRNLESDRVASVASPKLALEGRAMMRRQTGDEVREASDLASDAIWIAVTRAIGTGAGGTSQKV